jgi:hypothetical protein
MYEGNKIALEDIRNNTICVKTLAGIRQMKYKDDINSNLVYINNMPINNQRIFLIHQSEYCRYIDLNINAKLSLNEI